MMNSWLPAHGHTVLLLDGALLIVWDRSHIWNRFHLARVGFQNASQPEDSYRYSKEEDYKSGVWLYYQVSVVWYIQVS